jgi:hypothetical protein
MVLVKTSHHDIWNRDQVAIDIVKELIETGKAEVSLNCEGPCADSIHLYKMLDYICEKFNFNKSNINIHTVNFEEHHNEYNIIKTTQHWISSTLTAFNRLKFIPDKNVEKNLFGLMYNVPSWDRLCLLSHVYHNVKSPSMLFCNGTWESHKYNSYYLNTVTDYCPTEIYSIVNFLKSNPSPALDDLTDKPISAEDLLKVTTHYNNFFVDIVSETYTHGLSFFITEKTLRPILTKTPFIINGPKGYLSTLKSDYGIQSFDQWWDESYDQYQNYDRIKKIYQVIDYLDNLSISDRKLMYHNMTKVLDHNYQILSKLL